MVTVLIDIADNGVVKILQDDNYNGGGELYSNKVVYVCCRKNNYGNEENHLYN